MNFAFWHPFAVSSLVGILVGMEREKAQGGESVFGVRTFLLLALLGTVAGSLEDPIFALIVSILPVALISISYYCAAREKSEDRGLTTEVAAGLIFALGYISNFEPLVTAILGAFVAIVLIVKEPLHAFTRKISTAELRTVIILLLLAVSVLNLLEDEVIDRWGIFNPKRFGILILILATIEFASYALAKLIGRHRSSLVVGFLGGVVSSTAVIVSSLARFKETGDRHTALNMIAAAQLAALLEVLFVASLASSQVLLGIAAPVTFASLLIVLTLVFVDRTRADSASAIELKSPLDWKGVIRLSLLFVLLLASVAGAEKFVGDKGSSLVSFVGGIFELHGITLANSVMFANGQLARAAAVHNILLAVTGSLCGKIAVCWISRRDRFSAILSAGFLALILGVWLASFVRLAP